jgi:hypothetical protein
MSDFLEKAVLRTLAYADVFDYPMTGEEVGRWLIRIQNPESRIQNLRDVLGRLRKQVLITKKGEFYCLKGREEVFDLRERREKNAVVKWKVARRVGKWLRVIPTVKMVAVTGALAMNNCDEEDDVDLMIVTASGWLWTTRLVVTLVLELLGLRRKPGDVRVANKVCVNVWLDEGDLGVKPGKYGLYLAHEVLQAEPVVVKEDVYKRFLRTNEWVRGWLPYGWEWRKKKLVQVQVQEKIEEKGSRLRSNSSLVERLAYGFQRWYMRRKKTREVVSETRAMFHPEDVGRKIMSKFKARMLKLQLKS